MLVPVIVPSVVHSLRFLVFGEVLEGIKGHGVLSGVVDDRKDPAEVETFQDGRVISVLQFGRLLLLHNTFADVDEGNFNH